MLRKKLILKQRRGGVPSIAIWFSWDAFHLPDWVGCRSPQTPHTNLWKNLWNYLYSFHRPIFLSNCKIDPPWATSGRWPQSKKLQREARFCGSELGKRGQRPKRDDGNKFLPESHPSEKVGKRRSLQLLQEAALKSHQRLPSPFCEPEKSIPGIHLAMRARKRRRLTDSDEDTEKHSHYPGFSETNSQMKQHSLIPSMFGDKQGSCNSREIEWHTFSVLYF